MARVAGVGLENAEAVKRALEGRARRFEIAAARQNFNAKIVRKLSTSTTTMRFGIDSSQNHFNVNVKIKDII
jgi:hypothetical protein